MILLKEVRPCSCHLVKSHLVTPPRLTYSRSPSHPTITCIFQNGHPNYSRDRLVRPGLHQQYLLLACCLVHTPNAELQEHLLQDHICRVPRHRTNTERAVRPASNPVVPRPLNLLTIISSGLAPNETGHKYTVPAIQHVPTNTYMMGSSPIAEFLESTYPDPAVPLASELGREIETRARTAIGPVITKSLMPREIRILSPRAQEYFRRTREAAIGRPLEDLLDSGQEQQRWDAATDEVRALGELLQKHKVEGPFVLGARPSYTDFFIAASLQCARTVDEGVFERVAKFPGYRDIYDACQPYMERKD